LVAREQVDDPRAAQSRVEYGEARVGRETKEIFTCVTARRLLYGRHNGRDAEDFASAGEDAMRVGSLWLKVLAEIPVFP
jgi:hypothetical protein